MRGKERGKKTGCNRKRTGSVPTLGIVSREDGPDGGFSTEEGQASLDVEGDCG